MRNDVFGVLAKERATAAAEKRRPVKESDIRKGILVATVSGVLSACFSFGLAAGKPIQAISIEAGAEARWAS